MTERRYLQLDGIRLSYLEQGASSVGKPSLIILHGLMGCADTFIELLRKLDPAIHTIALDLPGSGLSERRSDIDPSLSATAKLVARFLKTLQLAKPVLLGHSHGGTVAMSLASQQPDTLTALILLSPAHPWFDEGDPLIRFYLTLPGRLFAYSLPWYPQWMQMMGLRRMAGPQSWDTPTRLKPYRDNLRTPGTMKHLLKLLSTWTRDMKQLAANLQQPIKLPTYLIWGDHDRAVPITSSTALLEHFTRWEIVTLPGIGHRPAEEASKECAGLIRTVLSWEQSDRGLMRIRPKQLTDQNALLPNP